MPEEHASLRTGESTMVATTVYLTRPHLVERGQQISIWPEQAAVIGRYGLPVATDVARLRNAHSEVLFIGDADPVDLLVFAWLRQHLSIRWLGVSDAFLNSLGIQVCPRIQIALASSEQETFARLAEFCPDYRSLLGSECSATLEAGMKIELEGAFSRSPPTSSN